MPSTILGYNSSRYLQRSGGVMNGSLVVEDKLTVNGSLVVEDKLTVKGDLTMDAAGGFRTDGRFYNLRSSRDHQTISKSATNSAQNSTVFRNDDHLHFEVQKFERWLVDLLIITELKTGYGLKWRFSIPSGYMWGRTICPSPQSYTASDFQRLTDSNFYLDNNPSSSKKLYIAVQGVVGLGGIAGKVRLQFAQQVAGATPTKVLDQSTLNVARWSLP